MQTNPSNKGRGLPIMATYAELADKVRGKVEELQVQRKSEADKILLVRTQCVDESRDPSDQESATVRAAQTEVSRFDVTLEDLRSQVEQFDREAAIEAVEVAASRGKADQKFSPAVVTNEPSPYNRESATKGTSFFRDLYSHTTGSRERGLVQRFETYSNEIELRMQERAVSTSSFAGLIPPQYLVDEYALIQRAGRVFLNGVRKLQLPDEGMNLVIPRGTTGASVAVQATENSAVSETDQVWANLTVPVISIAGQADVSRQTLERGTPGIDSIIFADIAAAYMVAADSQGLNGSGASGQALGVLGTAGIGQSTAYGAVLTVPLFLKKVAGAISSVQGIRLLAPDVIYMHPRRWSWLLSQVDTNGRPLFVPDTSGPFNAIGTFEGITDPTSQVPAGRILGLPVLLDANIPTTVGTNAEDVVIVARWEDLMLWQDEDGAPSDLRFEQTLGGQLTVKLVGYGYLAFTAGRYPSAVAVVGGADTVAGNGQIAPTF